MALEESFRSKKVGEWCLEIRFQNLDIKI